MCAPYELNSLPLDSCPPLPNFFCPKGKNVKKNLLKLLGILVLITFIAGFSGCESSGAGGGTGEAETIAVEGTWQLVGTYGTEKWIITESSIEYLSDWGSGFSTNYKADIISFSNNGLNSGDIAISSAGGASTTGLGYAVIQFTEIATTGDGEVGKYQIFRWATNQSDSYNCDFTQGYKDTEDGVPYINTVYNTAAAAIQNVTNANGFFSAASEGAEIIIRVEGTWELAGAYGTEYWEITNTTIEYSSDYGSGASTVFKADIIIYSNDGLNADDITFSGQSSSTNDPGYAVIQFTEIDGLSTGVLGKYQVFRWVQNASDSSTMNFTQGYKDAGSYANTVFDTATAAESNVTYANGFFNYSSNGAERQ